MTISETITFLLELRKKNADMHDEVYRVVKGLE